MGWHEHVDGVFHGCEKFFRPGYAANLVANWIPALQDVKDQLESGARIADVGCGKGASTLLMAKANPKSQFFGFDYHDKSIEAARESAKKEGVLDPSALRFRGRKNTRARTMILWGCSIASTTWAIRLDRQRMSANR
jgi:methylase of polypeptide subunit release factors